MFKDYDCTGDWLEHLIEVASPVEPADDSITRTLGYKVGDVVHRVNISVIRRVQETFQTAAQRDKVLGAFGLEFDSLREQLQTPEGRARLYSKGGG